MKLIIDIPEDVYEEIMIHNRELRASGKSSYYLEGLIQNGIPYVEPKQGDIISREALKKAINANGCRHSHYFDVFDVIDDVPTIQPKYFPPCEDCNKKMEEIRQAYDKMKAMGRPHDKWIPVTCRSITGDEEKELCEKLGVKEGSLEDWEKRVFTCPLPDDGQEILVSHGKYVCEDICSWDEYGCGLENNGDWDGINAWMPKPEPYQKGDAG